MGRSSPSTNRCSRPGECLVRGKHERYQAERGDKRPIYSIRHDTYQFAGYRAALQRTLSRAFRARKYIINYWLRRPKWPRALRCTRVKPCSAAEQTRWLSLPAPTCDDDRQNRRRRMMVASLWRMASGTKVPDRAFDSADEPRPGVRCNSG